MINQNDILTLLPEAFQASNLALPGRQAGKVRDWYSLEGGRRLIVTTDRLSAFDRILACVPYKGQVLNQLSNWWMAQTADIVPNHLVSVPDPNAVVVAEVEPIMVEVIVRGYITGVTSTALWYRYSLGERSIYGYSFADGYQKNQALAEPIITPTTKGGESGHDERLTCAEVVEQGLLDAPTWDTVQRAALGLFKRGQEVAAKAGLILVDTKYEFGLTADGQVMLIDEIHTPDSSRFWRADSYAARFSANEEPENFDKEFIRLEYARLGYRGDGVPPTVPDTLWVEGSQRYIQIYEMLTGLAFEPGEYPIQARLERNLARCGGEMSRPLVVVLMGSRADEAHCQKIAEAARGFDLDVELRVGSAHKTPGHVTGLLAGYEQDPRPKVYITVAGRSNALSGFTDGSVLAPVIACPPPSESFGGADVYSSLRMPSGIAPALVLEPANAALLAAKILGLADAQVRSAVAAYQKKQSDKIMGDDADLFTQASKGG